MPLFEKTPSYEDGNANTYVKTAYMMTGIATRSTTTTSGSMLAIYDRDSTTYFGVGYQEGDQYVQWKFNGKKRFKNIYAYCWVHNDAGVSTDVCYLQGSNDGTNWTNLDSFNIAAAATIQKSLLASEVQYKYIRIFLDVVSGTAELRIYNSEGVI